MTKTYSTKQVAQLAGIHLMTLHRWRTEGKVRASRSMPIMEGRTLWRWTDRDVEKVKRYKAAHYWEKPSRHITHGKQR